MHCTNGHRYYKLVPSSHSFKCRRTQCLSIFMNTTMWANSSFVTRRIVCQVPADGTNQKTKPTDTPLPLLPTVATLPAPAKTPDWSWGCHWRSSMSTALHHRGCDLRGKCCSWRGSEEGTPSDHRIESRCISLGPAKEGGDNGRGLVVGSKCWVGVA